MEHVFFTTTIHLSSWPYKKVKNDPPEQHRQDEAIAKMHRFCHEIYSVPVTWIVSWGAMKKYGTLLRGYCTKYGDEVGIMEYGIYPKNILEGETEPCQEWVEELGLTRPDEFISSEPELVGTESWNDMPYEKQKRCISYLKKQYEEELGVPVTTFAVPFINADTIRVFHEVGITCSWAYNWNYFCEGINNKGCPFSPFYPGTQNHNVPEQNREECKTLAVHWGMSPYCLLYGSDTKSRRDASWCLNSMELTNRSMGLNQSDYDRRLIAERVSQAAYNPYVHLPVQLEAVWMDEEDISGCGRHEQFPSFNPHCTENFYKQIEECLRLGAQPVTHREFAEWHQKNIGDTAEMVTYSEDVTGGAVGNGKDSVAEPFLIYSDKTRQYWFSRAYGINYIRKYEYDRIQPNRHGEYPFFREPQVYLKTKHGIVLRTGIHIADGRAYYAASGLSFTAYEDVPDYAGAVWSLNLPEEVAEQDLQMQGIKRLKLIREKNAALFFADFQEGENELLLWSDVPAQFVRVARKERVGRRYEIWIENTGNEMRFARLHEVIDRNLRIGGFWWDGIYYHSIYAFDSAWYDYQTGEFSFGACYPRTFHLNRGYTRLSLELL